MDISKVTAPIAVNIKLGMNIMTLGLIDQATLNLWMGSKYGKEFLKQSNDNNMSFEEWFNSQLKITLDLQK